MATNVHVERYFSRYHQSRTSTVAPKNLFGLVPKPRRLPWINLIPKIVDDEYFFINEKKKKSSERKVRSCGYKAKLFLKIIIPYQLCLERERI
jgi:hypothetical protein